MLHISPNRYELAHLVSLIEELDAISPADPDDRRLHPRIDFRHPLWVHLPHLLGQPWVHVYSRNLSTGGLAFISRLSLSTDSRLIVSHHLNEDPATLVPHLALAQVRFCRPIDDTFHEIGLQFMAVTPDPTNTRHIPPEWIALTLRSVQ